MIQQLKAILLSRRTTSVVALSFSSGLPLGLVYYSIPVWMTQAGIDIRVVGHHFNGVGLRVRDHPLACSRRGFVRVTSGVLAR